MEKPGPEIRVCGFPFQNKQILGLIFPKTKLGRSFIMVNEPENPLNSTCIGAQSNAQ